MQAAIRLLAQGLVGLLLTAPAAAAEASTVDDRWFWLPRQNPVIAASLSLAWNGTGQLYNGETEKGLGMMAGWLAFPLAFGVDSLTGSSWLRLFAFGANVGIKAWSVTDAWTGAGSAPAQAPATSPAP